MATFHMFGLIGNECLFRFLIWAARAEVAARPADLPDAHDGGPLQPAGLVPAWGAPQYKWRFMHGVDRTAFRAWQFAEGQRRRWLIQCCAAAGYTKEHSD